MTSSLVGSEMCIRDSIADVRSVRQEFASLPSKLRGRRFACERPRVTVPVSYTHLTLPTICSV
eukprot:7243565-Prorocentrum_lima.AAC.1